MIVLGFAYADLRTDTYLGRWFAWRASDVGDMYRFPALEIAASDEPRGLHVLSSAPTFTDIHIESAGGAAERPTTLEELLVTSDTTAFVVLAGDAVAAEWYAAGTPATERTRPVTSFSLAKSVTAMLVAAALADGRVGSLDDAVTQYLPALASVDPEYENVTIQHLLDMRSGVRFRDHDLPWGDKARVYYEPHLRGLATNLPVTVSPGASFKYNSYNPVLLGLVLESATGENVASYFEKQVWERIGAESPASWSVSSTGETLPKMESGLNATPLDFARLGQLLLDRGEVGADRVLPASWVEALFQPDPARLVEPEARLHYQHGWWVYAPGEGKPLAVAGHGHLGQYLFVYPDLDVVVARFGTSTGGVESWRAVFDEVAREASRLSPAATGSP